MRARSMSVLCAALAAACVQDVPGPDARLVPSFAADGISRPVVLVNPNVRGNGAAKTIQEGIDMVDAGGTVLVLPGTYDERLVIDKGLTLESIGDGGGAVVIQTVLETAPPEAGQAAVIRVATSEPVVIRHVTINHEGVRAINGFAAPGDDPVAVDLVVEDVRFNGRFDFAPPQVNNGVSVVNNAVQSEGRARLVVRNSRILTDGVGISIGGDVDAEIRGNTIGTHNTGAPGACVFVSPIGQGVTVPAGAQTNVDILDNDLLECGTNSTGRIANGIQVVGAVGDPTTGTVNIIGNRMRNSVRVVGSCNTAGINYQFYSGRIEYNTFSGVVQSCAPDVAQARPAAIWIGTRTLALPAVRVTVRFNDIQGNAFAGLRVGTNQSLVVDASCNWWGSASGPSGLGPGTGDAVVKEGTASAAPAFTPFATTPIAGTGATSCE